MSFFKRKQNPDCKKCGLDKKCNNPKLQPIGEGREGILILGSAPDYDDDSYGHYDHSQEYLIMKSELSNLNLDIDTDCFFMTSAACYSDNDEIDIRHVEYCRPNVYDFIKNNDIKVVIPLGKIALNSLYKHRVEDVNGSAQWRGKHIPDQKLGCWVCPIMDAKWFEENSNDEQAQLVWGDDLYNALNQTNKPFPKLPSFKENIKIVMEYRELIRTLDHIIAIQPEYISFDYETNTFRPYHPGAKLLTMSMYIPELETTFAFPLFWRKHFTRAELKEIIKRLRKLFTSKHTKFIAHNFDMEDSWTSEILGFFIQNWFWDTMIMQHLLDVTPKTKGLKFQCFLRWGVEGYDDYSKKWMTITDDSDDTDATSFNKLEEANLPKVLEYNAYDSLFTWMLYVEQVEEFDFDGEGNEKRQFCATLYNEVAVALSRSSQMGFKVNLEYFAEQKEILIAQRAEIEQKILENKEVQLFKKHTGEDFKITSADHLRILFYDIMGFKAKKKTTKGVNSADHEALTNFDNEIARAILQIRKIDKIVGTYIGQYERLSIDSFIHPSNLLHVARSGRSSNTNPNMQNVSKRDAEAKRIVRTGIIPPVGYHFGEIDYDTLEVKIFACYCKDPMLIKYLDDPHSDMHRDQAMKIFKLDEEWQITKTIRFEAKNGWVFALFYGSYWKSCGRKIWEKIISQKDLILGKKKDKDGSPIGPDIHLRDHLKKKGIKTMEDFQFHLKKCEEKLWNIFAVTREYQQNAFKSALEKGFVESYSGFRRGGYIERGQIINTPVQGQGCQCLLDSYRLLWKQSRREVWKTYFAGQIHDSILPMLHPTEVIHVLNSLYKTMCVDMEEKNDWLIVPMGIEASIAKLDDPWYNLIDFKLLDGVWVSSKEEIPIQEVLELPKQRIFT